MTAVSKLSHEFVEYIPDRPVDGVVYISVPYATAVHKCCCGCGREVVTPLSPTDWKLIFDGETISLSPSIGSWSFDCQSHYWIERNSVRWAPRWSREQVEAGRQLDHLAKERHYGPGVSAVGAPRPPKSPGSKGLWSRFWTWLSIRK